MTSPLRRKRPTTAPNTPPAKARDAASRRHYVRGVVLAVIGVVSWTAVAQAGHIVTQPIPAKQTSGDARSKASPTTLSATNSGKSTASKTTQSNGLKWTAPKAAGQSDAADTSPSKDAAKEASATASKPAVAAKSPSEGNSATPASLTKIESSKFSQLLTEAGKASATKSANAATTTTAASTGVKAATSAVQRIAAHDDAKSSVIQTAVTETKIDPFGDDEKVNAKSPAKRNGTPAKRAAQAGVQSGRENTPADPFPTDPPLGQPPTQPQDKRGPLQEEITQAPRRGPEPCPSPRDLKPLSQISNNIDAEPGEFPAECGLGNETFDPRRWSMTTYTWQATGLCHKPLYFEDVQLERYGNSCSPFFQPLISGAHFFLTVPALPYKMGLEAPCECVYTLGTYRPGSCAVLHWPGAA